MKDKILVITAFVPHRAAAGEKNTMIMINDLADTYDVDLIYYKYDFNDSYIPEKQNVRVVHEERNSLMRKVYGMLNYPFIHPFFSIRFSWNMLRMINKLNKENHYRAVILNHSYTFLFGKLGLRNVPKLLYCHDVIAQRIGRTSNKLMTRICKNSERKMLDIPNSYIFSVSQKDCDLITSLYGKPAYVALAYIDDMIVNTIPTKVEDYFCMFADWTRKDNLGGAEWFINEVVPMIDFEMTIKIIGRKFPESLKSSNPKVNLEVMGFVDDPYQILSNSKGLITPLFEGAGTKQKVIEALACGIPSFGNEIAFEGLPVKYSDYLYLCHTPEDYKNAFNKSSLSMVERMNLKKDFILDYQSDSFANFISRL